MVSGAETAAHARENGRIVVMFCAFEGPPKIVRIHGNATLIRVEDPRYAEFAEVFPANPRTRAFVHIRVDRVSDSCGYSLPLYQFQRQRATLDRWASAKTPEGLKAYRAAKNCLPLSRHQAPQIEKDARANQWTANNNESDKRERMDPEQRAHLNQQSHANQKARPFDSGFNEWLLHVTSPLSRMEHPLATRPRERCHGSRSIDTSVGRT
jgi:hypothetical protein